MEDNYSIEKIHIQKLSGPNYRSWMIQLQRLLIGKSLWNMVRYGVSAPGAATPPRAEGSGKSLEDAGTTETQTSGFTDGRTEVDDAKASTLIMGLCILNALQHVLRLATVRSGPDRGLFWRPFKKTGPYGPAPSDCSLVPKILDRTVRSGLFII